MGLVVAGVVLVLRGGDGPAASEEVDLPDRGVAATSRTNLACEPAGCEVWRVEDISERPVVVSDDAVVYLGRDELVAYDARGGQQLWRRPAPGGGLDVRTAALSEHGLALVPGSPFAEQSDDPAANEARVVVFDPADGTPRFDVEPELRRMSELAWLDDRLVVVGQAADRDDVAVVVGISAAGEILWRHESRAFPLLLADEAALLLVGDEVVRLDASDGRVRWRVSGQLAPFSEVGDELVVLDREAGEVRVVDAQDGVMLETIAVADAEEVGWVGPWVAVATRADVRVYDRDGGDELLRRRLAPADTDGESSAPRGRPRLPAAVEVGDRVAVAWMDDRAPGEVELATYDLDGTPEDTLTVQVSEQTAWVRLGRLSEQGEVVHLTVHRGPDAGSLIRVDLDAQRVLEVDPGNGSAAWHDELLVTPSNDGVHIIGPGGQIEAHHTHQLASTDPLIVHGVGGILRLNRELVTAVQP